MLWSLREKEIILNFPVIYTVVGRVGKIPNSCHVQRNWITQEKTSDWPLIDTDILRTMRKSWK